MTLEELNSLFLYTSENRDKWSILKLDRGLYRGDCEDYSLTVLYYLVCNESLLEFWKHLIIGKAKMHYVVTRTGDGHAVLQVGDKYIDNWSKDWVDKDSMHDLGHRFVKVYWLSQIAVKMLYGKLRGLL